MKRLQHTRDGELIVHYDSAIDSSYTLCGHDVIGDSFYGEMWTPCVPSKKRVNCQQCIAIRDHVLGRKPHDPR